MPPYDDAPPAPRLPELREADGSLRQDLILVPTAAFVFGFVSGLLTSSRLSGRQFLAENAHRLPTTVQGWYFYQKTKNYRVIYGGVLGGLRTGGRLGAWTIGFLGLCEGLEIAVHRSLGERAGDEGQSRIRTATRAVAGGTLALVAGQVYNLSRYGAPRRMLLGVGLGAVAGGALDLRDWVKTRLPETTKI